MEICAGGQAVVMAIQLLVSFQIFLQTHLKRYCNTINKCT